MTDLGWTISDAFEQFDATGMPVDRAGFRAVVRAARRNGNIKPIGENKSGDSGGRGQLRYEIEELQQMHKDLARWLAVPPPGDT
jgi:hypothetical protein